MSKLPKSHLAITSSQPAFWLTLVGIFIFGLGLIRLSVFLVSRASQKSTAPAATLIVPSYTAHVAQETDPIKLATIGAHLLGQHLPEYAAINFARASELDPNYRDAAYGYAYATIAANGKTLSTTDLKAISAALDRALAVDPSYLPALKLQIAVAQTSQQTGQVADLQARIAMLETQKK